MTHRSNSDLPPKLLQGRQAFEQWRSQQETRCRLPDHLWSLAVELAREYGFTKTAKTLRVEYNLLKKKSLNSVKHSKHIFLHKWTYKLHRILPGRINSQPKP